MSYSAVKCSFNQFCKNDFLHRKLNDVVFNSNKIAFEAYCFANLHILRCLTEHKELPLLNQGFFQKCCALVSTFYDKKEMQMKDKELVDTFKIYQTFRPTKYKVAYRDNITIVLNYIAKDMEVATINHLTLNFYNRFSKYLKSKFKQLTCKDVYEVCKGVYEKDYNGSNELVIEYRKKLGNLPPYENYIKKNPSFVLSVYHEILNYRKEKGERIFSLLPHKLGFQMSNITIDNAVLRDLIVGNKLVEAKRSTELREDINNNPRKYWLQFFEIEKYETNTKKFAMFKTDGKSVSILFEVPKKEIEPKGRKRKTECLNMNDYDTIVGIDPGLRYTFVGYNNHNEVVKCSSKEYYHHADFNWKNSKQQRCYKRNQEFVDFKSNMPSPKTDNIEELNNYITYSLKGIDNAFKVHYDNPFRKWKFKTYIQKQKIFLSICKKITKKKVINDKSKVIVGFGDWSNPKDCIIRGHRRGPVKEIKSALKKWCKVVDVDEFRTSKLCCCCHQETTKVKFGGCQVNSVLRCSNNECGITIDRDINGAKNIFMVFSKILKKEKLPEAFCR